MTISSGHRGLSRLAAAAICTIAVALQPGCLARYTGSGGIEPAYRPMEGKKYETVGQAEGESSSFNFFWLIPFTPAHRLEEAVDNAIGEKGGDNMINLRWWFERQYWILGTINVIQVQGTVVRYIDE